MTVKELRIELQKLEEQGREDSEILIDIGEGSTRPVEYFWSNVHRDLVLD